MDPDSCDKHYAPPTSDTIQTKPFPIRGKIFFSQFNKCELCPLFFYIYLSDSYAYLSKVFRKLKFILRG